MSGSHEITLEMLETIDEPYIDMKINIWTTKENLINFDIFEHLYSLGFKVNECEVKGTNGKTIN